ncbi:MAG: DUF1549 domain-containing protein, partial [Planctomycetota bacterium]|nr:DUF1549 domain-containing protein [Planctomycetota bacterium]
MRHGLWNRLALILALTATTMSAVAEERPVDFDRDIAPILSTHCLRCHGTLAPEAGLDLTDPAKATSMLESGVRAIAPGDPGGSEMLRRLAASLDEGRMPPVGEPLDEAAIASLRRWIAGGAPWPSHWAYRPIESSPPPDVADANVASSSANPIDGFIQKRLLDNGLHPSPPADRRTWLRRVTFDLTGLPPTPDELATFKADTSPDAFERVVDR